MHEIAYPIKNWDDARNQKFAAGEKKTPREYKMGFEMVK